MIKFRFNSEPTSSTCASKFDWESWERSQLVTYPPRWSLMILKLSKILSLPDQIFHFVVPVKLTTTSIKVEPSFFGCCAWSFRNWISFFESGIESQRKNRTDLTRRRQIWAVGRGPFRPFYFVDIIIIISSSRSSFLRYSSESNTSTANNQHHIIHVDYTICLFGMSSGQQDMRVICDYSVIRCMHRHMPIGNNGSNNKQWYYLKNNFGTYDRIKRIFFIIINWTLIRLFLIGGRVESVAESTEPANSCYSIVDRKKKKKIAVSMDPRREREKKEKKLAAKM